MPLNQLEPKRLGDFLRQHGFAGSRLALDEQRALKLDGGVHGHAQLIGGDIGVGTVEDHSALLVN